MARIGKQKAAQILRRVVAKHGPETVYQERDKNYRNTGTCRYVTSKGAPMCIVGVALVEELGFRHPALKKETGFYFAADSEDNWNDADAGLYSQLPELQALLTPDAAKVFQRAQTLQDDGVTWGEAVQIATAGIR